MSSFVPDQAQRQAISRSETNDSRLEDDEPLSLGVSPGTVWHSREQASYIDRVTAVRNHRRPSTIDLTTSEDNEEEPDDIDYVDLTADDAPDPLARPRRPTRNANIDETHESLAEYTYDGKKLKANQTVELAEVLGLHRAQYVKIKSIHKDRVTQKVLLRGVAYTRAKFLKGRLPCKLNEVVAVWEVDDDDDRVPEEQALVEVPCEAVLKAKRELVVTNKDFPAHRFLHSNYRSVEEIEKTARLVCRWQYFLHYCDAGKRQAHKAHQWVLIHNTQGDVEDPAYRQEDEKRLNAWRGQKISGGSYTPKGRPLQVLNLDDDDDDDGTNDEPSRSTSSGLRVPIPGQRYTFGDVFCGAGGASRGALMAGFEIEFAVDHWNSACDTYELNFPTAKLHRKDVFEFLMDPYTRHYVDVIHISPPCQPHSPAHTVEGKDDEANIAALYACTELIEKTRPRIFTLEQTFGILHEKSMYHFAALVHGFTRHGYSVQWKVVHLKTWGLPQVRRRLIMIGSCPGEPLPPFPQPTHSEAGPRDGLAPLVTARQALATIPRGAHSPAAARSRDLPSWNPDAPLPRTITTSGGQNYHYSGKRDLTDHEFAVLQGFPHGHRFRGPGVKKQIGNAFPPCVVKVLYDHLRQWLQKVDGIEPGPEVMDLTSDEDGGNADAGDASGAGEVYRQYVGDLTEDEAMQRALRASQQESQPVVVDLEGDEAESARIAGINDEEDRIRRVEVEIERASITSPAEHQQQRRRADARMQAGMQEVVVLESEDEDDSASDTLEESSEHSSMPPLRADSVASSVTLGGELEHHDAMSVDSSDDDDITYVGSSPVRMEDRVISLDD